MKDRGIILITMFIVILDAYFLGYKSAFYLCMIYYTLDLVFPIKLINKTIEEDGRNK